MDNLSKKQKKMVIITLEQMKNFTKEERKRFLSIRTTEQAEKFMKEMASKK